MSENKTEFSEKLKQIFSSKNEVGEVEIASEKDELVVETASMFEQESLSIGEPVENRLSGEFALDGDQADIEASAKEYYNNNHASDIEEKIKNVQENARNTFGQEETETSELADNVSKTQNNPKDVCDVECNETEDTQKTKDYDMSQLLKILGNENAFSEDEEEESPKKKKKKIKSEPEYTEENDIVQDDSDITEYKNEYRYDFEYTDKIQSTEVFNSLRKNAIVSTVSLILTFITTVFCIWIELGNAAGLPFDYLIHSGRYGRIFSMVSLQILAFCSFLNLDGLYRGITKLSLKHPAPEGCAFIMTVVCALHTIYTCAFGYEHVNYRTFCFVSCIMLLMLSVNSFIKAFTKFKTFTVVLSKKPKLATQTLNALSAENGTFAKYLSEESEVMTVSKTDSVSDFIKTTNTIPNVSRISNAMMYIVVAISVITVIASALFLNVDLYDSVNRGMVVLSLSLPVNLLLLTAFPYYITSLRLNKMRSYALGEAACDLYENAGVISFDDTEVFPPKAVKVTSIKTYNDHPIDKVIVYMAKTFDKLGGPLSYVFSNSIQSDNEQEYSQDDIMLLENSSDGLHIKIGDDDILIGKSAYLRMYDIEAPVDAADESEIRSLTSILYLVCNNSLAAKMYIRYSINSKFEKILKGLYDAGICCGIKTYDPGVDDQLIVGNLKGSNYPIGVIKRDIKEHGKTEQTVSTGIISLSNTHNFLKSFIMLDKLRGTYKTNAVLSVISCVLGLIFSLGMIFALESTISALTIVLFQVIFIIPQLLISLLTK